MGKSGLRFRVSSTVIRDHQVLHPGLEVKVIKICHQRRILRVPRLYSFPRPYPKSPHDVCQPISRSIPKWKAFFRLILLLFFGRQNFEARRFFFSWFQSILFRKNLSDFKKLFLFCSCFVFLSFFFFFRFVLTNSLINSFWKSVFLFILWDSKSASHFHCVIFHIFSFLFHMFSFFLHSFYFSVLSLFFIPKIILLLSFIDIFLLFLSFLHSFLVCFFLSAVSFFMFVPFPFCFYSLLSQSIFTSFLV